MASDETTPYEMVQKARAIASQVLGLPEAEKDSEMIKLKQANPVLHALVKGAMKAAGNDAKE